MAPFYLLISGDLFRRTRSWYQVSAHLVIKPVLVDNIIKVDEIEKVAQGRKSTLTNVVPCRGQQTYFSFRRAQNPRKILYREVLPWELVSFEDHGIDAFSGQDGGGIRSCGSTADDEDCTALRDGHYEDQYSGNLQKGGGFKDVGKRLRDGNEIELDFRNGSIVTEDQASMIAMLSPKLSIRLICAIFILFNSVCSIQIRASILQVTLNRSREVPIFRFNVKLSIPLNLFIHLLRNINM